MIWSVIIWAIIKLVPYFYCFFNIICFHLLQNLTNYYNRLIITSSKWKSLISTSGASWSTSFITAFWNPAWKVRNSSDSKRLISWDDAPVIICPLSIAINRNGAFRSSRIADLFLMIFILRLTKLKLKLDFLTYLFSLLFRIILMR